MSVQGVSGSTPNYSIDDIVSKTKTGSGPGGFRRVMGSVVGAATNVVAPGVGTVIGNAIGGGGYLGEMQQFLELQRAVNMEQRQYEAQSNVMKAKHDAAMSAIRNIK